jgi:hypothetical protein
MRRFLDYQQDGGIVTVLDGYKNEITDTRQLCDNPETRRRVADFLNKTAA